jgi:hypothetical protein
MRASTTVVKSRVFTWLPLARMRGFQLRVAVRVKFRNELLAQNVPGKCGDRPLAVPSDDWGSMAAAAMQPRADDPRKNSNSALRTVSHVAHDARCTCSYWGKYM